MSPFAHLALIFSYTLLSTVVGMYAAPLIPDLPHPAGGYALSTGLFLFLALLHEVVARRVALSELRGELMELRRHEIEQRSDLEFAREEIAHLRRDAANVNASSSEVQLLKSLLAQVADRIGPSPGSGTAVVRGSVASAPPPPTDATGTTTLDQLRAAIEDNRVDLYLQPVVSLPQRKTRFYECFSRIRTERGTVLSPDRYLEMAETAGLLTTIDNYLLFRCVQVVRRVRRRSRDMGFFVNMTVRTLEDQGFVEPFLEFLDQNPEFADHLIFEFPLSEFQTASPAARAVLLDLIERRYRFSVDRVERLDLDIDWLASRGVRFIKVEVARLLSPKVTTGELQALRAGFDRNAVDLIAEKVETETQVAAMLDLRVDFGQGWVFGEPRRSREES